MEDVCGLQLKRLVGLTLFIHQQGKCDAGVLSKSTGVLAVPKTYGC